jgi:hypothetical protein
MGVDASGWCVACGRKPQLVVSFERRGIMSYYGACIAHVHQVADEAVNDLAASIRKTATRLGQ